MKKYTLYFPLSACFIMLFFCFAMQASAKNFAVFHQHKKTDTAAKNWYLFCYFADQKKGMQYALSNDGLNWKVLNNGKPWLVPQLGKEKLMRDPSINKGQDGLYRVVWTTGWTGDAIGYAYSKDLIHWSEEKAIPVMQGIDSVKMSWAPEIFYDDQQQQYMIMWASAVKNDWSIYYVTTANFEAFSKPKILLNNGFAGGGKRGDKGPIDAYIYKDSTDKYILFYKQDDNTGIANLYYRFASSPVGEWQNEMGPVTPSTGDEGPSCIKIGNEYFVFTDPAESHKAYVFISTDFKTWKRKTTNLVMSHGTVLQITSSAANKLMKQLSR